MDPNVTLAELRELLDPDLVPSEPEIEQDRYDAARFHFEALDKWLSSGGFLPTSWER